jgi:hypothetical protein
MTYSEKRYDVKGFYESQACGIEQLKFQQYLAQCQEVEEPYKGQPRCQWYNATCAKWYCYNCMTFESKEALQFCQTCGSGIPDFYKDGSYDPECFWSIQSTLHRGTEPTVDVSDKEVNHSKIFNDLKNNMPKDGEAKAKLVSAVQVACKRYVPISAREIGKYVYWEGNSSMGSDRSMMMPDSDDDLNKPIDSLMSNDEGQISRRPTTLMIALYCFQKDKRGEEPL